MEMQGFAAHLLGNLLIVGVLGLGTVACFIAAIVMLIRPGEQNEDHPKYLVMHDDCPDPPDRASNG